MPLQRGRVPRGLQVPQIDGTPARRGDASRSTRLGLLVRVRDKAKPTDQATGPALPTPAPAAPPRRPARRREPRPDPSASRSLATFPATTTTYRPKPTANHTTT